MIETMEFKPDEMDLSQTEETSEEETTEEEEIVVESEEASEEETAAAGSDLEAQVRQLQTDLYRAGQEITRLREDRTVKEDKPAPKKADAEGEALTHEQLVGLIKEHGDNPDVMARIIDHVAENKARAIATTIRDETVKDVGFQQWYNENKKINDGVVSGYYQTSPQLKDEVASAVKNFGLERHPLGELFVIATMELANKEQARTDAESARATELKTQKGLDKTRGGPVKGRSKASLSSEEKAIADRLGVKHEVYAKFKGSDTASASQGT